MNIVSLFTNHLNSSIMNIVKSINISSFLVGLAFLLLPAVLFARDDASGQTTSDRIINAFYTMETVYPQQTLFIHIDKEEFLAGETIWFKAYLVNATTLEPDTLSTNMHLNLLNTNGDIVTSLLLRMENGMTHGNIHLPDSISEGNYEVIAYTDWMQNFDKRFYFNKDLYVFNPIEENFIRRSDLIRNRRFNRQLSRLEEQMQFAFFPEGGNMVAGLENRVAFKAANELGAGVDAEGILRDGHGAAILEFTTLHNGMGSFAFTPEPGVEYTARVRFANGEVKKVPLPKAESRGLLLSALQSDGHIMVSVQSNFDPATPELTEGFYLLAHTRGRPYHMEHFTLDNRAFQIHIPVENLPTGVSNLKLFTAGGTPVAERLMFINRNDIQDAVVLDHETHRTDGEDMISINLALNNFETKGSYSLAVVDASHPERDYRSNIASELLLFGDLGYRIKDPGFYLDPEAAKGPAAADLVMMTHGWKRFDMENILNNKFPEIVYGFPDGITLRGTVTPRSSARKTGQVNVELSIHQDDGIEIYSTTTDEDGNFSFTNLFYDELFMAMLRVDSRHDRRAMEVRLGGASFEAFQYSKNFQSRHLQVTSRGDDWERVPRPETVLKRRGIIQPRTAGTPSMYAQVDQVIYFDDIRDQYATVLDVLRTRVRGVRIVDGQITLRGPSSLFFTNEPLFLIDETIVSRSAFLGVSVRQIERLAVMSGPQSAILGARGTNGALLIYTLRGDSQRDITYDYVLKGFHAPAESFEAKIHTDQYARFDMDRTLFWEPYLELEEYGEFSVSFPSDENVRNLRIIIQGIDEKGRITFHDEVL